MAIVIAGGILCIVLYSFEKRATLLFKHVLFLQPSLFFTQPIRMYYLFITTIILFINFCATAIVGTKDVHPKGCKNPLSNKFSSRLETIILPKIALIFPVPAKKTALLELSPMILLLDCIFWKTVPVPANTVIPNFIHSLPEDVLLSTSPLLKLRLSNLFNLISVYTRNFFTV